MAGGAGVERVRCRPRRVASCRERSHARERFGDAWRRLAGAAGSSRSSMRASKPGMRSSRSSGSRLPLRRGRETWCNWPSADILPGRRIPITSERPTSARVRPAAMSKDTRSVALRKKEDAAASGVGSGRRTGSTNHTLRGDPWRSSWLLPAPRARPRLAGSPPMRARSGCRVSAPITCGCARGISCQRATCARAVSSSCRGLSATSVVAITFAII